MTRTRIGLTTDARALNRRTDAVAGIVGAVVYTMFVEAVNVVANGVEAFFYPFRQIGAVILGSNALHSNYNVLTAIAVGTVVHFAIAAGFGILIGWVVIRLAVVSGVGLITLGLIVELAFYSLDVFVIFPAAFPWFLDNNRLTQSLGHAVFGGVTGAWLAARRSA